MSAFEKRFVNSSSHSRQVAEQAVRRLRHIPIQAGQRYLDVGCGNGLATLHVAGVFRLQATGVDLDAAQIELAQAAAGDSTDLSFMTASATELPFDTGCFDIVFSNKAMHHVPDWRRAIEEIKRVVARGGHVVFADLNTPPALAPLLRRTIGHRAGVFTRRDLDGCFADLNNVHRKTYGVYYEAVFVKS